MGQTVRITKTTVKRRVKKSKAGQKTCPTCKGRGLCSEGSIKGSRNGLGNGLYYALRKGF